MDAADKFTPQARLRIEQPAKATDIGTYHPAETLKTERGPFVLPLTAQPTEIVLGTDRYHSAVLPSSVSAG
jgi:hypothetical protein